MLFETRYFWAVFTEKNPECVKKIRSIFDKSKNKFVSSVSIYEVHKLTLESEGEIVADLRVSTIKRDFEVVNVDSEIAEEGARIAHSHRTPTADSLIMATAKILRLPCVTDDPHFDRVKTVWL